MNLELLPEDLKKDIEDQSLQILEGICDRILVIGGWGVRAHLGEGHHRYTLDIDGVTDEDTLKELDHDFRSGGFEAANFDWGIKFSKGYVPLKVIQDHLKDIVDKLEIRIEISPPKIKEHDTHHFFEFDLTNFNMKEISYHNKPQSVLVRVPPIEAMAAVKLGLPVDYKNNHDSAMLLVKCKIEEVIKVIRNNNDWSSLVLRRMSKLKGRIIQKGSIENMLAKASGLDIKEHIKRLEYIEGRLIKK